MMENNVHISELLKANHETLVQDWLASSGSHLRAHIDQYFKNLNTPDQDVPPPIPEGYSLRQLIIDYKLLREILFNFLEIRKEMNPSSRKFLIYTIDKMLRIIVEHFVSEVDLKDIEINDILNSINDGFVTVDKNFTITGVNEQHVRLSKKSREEQIGRNFFKVFPGTNDPESDYYKGYHKAMKERIFVSFESYYPPLDIWTQVNVVPKSTGGIAIFYSDITLQKKAQRTLETEKLKFEALFLDSSAPMALLRGEKFTYEKINPKYADLFKGRLLLNKPLVEALPELRGTMFPKIMKDVYETGSPFIGKEMLVPLIREAGGPLVNSYFDFTYSRIDDSQGKSYGIYIHAIDVTEKVNARKAIERALHSRDEFLSIASHELKTPLTSLKLQIQLAIRKIVVGGEKKISSESIVNLFESNVIQINRLVRLVDDMLDISRIESGNFSYQFERVNLCDLVKKIHEQFKDTFRNNSSGLSLDCDPVAYGNFDKERIEQVLINLLTNALKYGDNTDVQITLRVKDKKARISVTDKGRGISDSDHKRIFERFERLVSAKEISGFGIGLYISKQIVEAHNGEILVESFPGKGSTFTIILPID